MSIRVSRLPWALACLIVSISGDRPAGILVEARAAAGTGEVGTFAGNAQHTGIFEPAATNLSAIRWSTTIDLRKTFANTHYGSPLVTAGNTVIVPVKTESDGFQIRAFDANTGKERYRALETDYVLPAHNWILPFGPALAAVRDQAGGPVRQHRLYYAGAGGTLFYITNPDRRRARPVRVAFYGLDAFDRDEAGFSSTVFINTPLTADNAGNVFFGFRVQGVAPAPLSTTQSGFARVAPDGTATWVLAGSAAGDAAITRATHNAAPALSNDERTLYVVVKAGTTNAYAYLLGLDAETLATKFKVFLRDPRNNRVNNATVSDDSTASPMVAPDGDVYLGVLANPNNGSRGFLLRFSADLAAEKTPGAFGWDSTPAVVPATMVPSYSGPSTYLLFTKYNNYRFSDGDGVNRIALLDPNATQVDPHPTANGLVVMREVATMIGPTPDGPTSAFPHAVREWCINTAAVNPATKSIFVPNEDGRIYRWDLRTNSLSQAVALTPGFGEPYVPTIIGPDGTVFTLNGGTLFAVGTKGWSVTMTSSKPDAHSVVEGLPLTFAASVFGPWLRLPVTNGSVVFTDRYYPVATATSVTSELGRAALAEGIASVTTNGLPAGTHFITATHGPSGRSATLVQKIHAFATVLNVVVSGSTITATASAPVGTPTGMVTLTVDGQVTAQMPLNAFGVVVFDHCLSAGAHTVTTAYASDPIFASSSQTLTVVRTAGTCPGG